jgi:hypothetical protein
MTYIVTTKTGRTVEAKCVGNRIRIMVLGTRFTDIAIEWPRNVEHAAMTFQRYVNINGGIRA